MLLLIVNTASKCGFTPQYAGLQKLYERFGKRGFEVLAFPCNDFGAQEPASEPEIKTFCEERYKTTFPLFGKVRAKGPKKSPLYRFLTERTSAKVKGEIPWNFTKFLVNKKGEVIARYAPGTKPLSKDIVGAVEKALGEK